MDSMISSQGLNFLWWAAYVWAASVSAGTLVDLAPSHSASSSHYDSLGTEPVKTDQSVHKKERDSRLFGKEKTDDSLFSQIYFDLPENEEVPVDRKKFSAWLETFSQRPGFADPENSQERKELVSYLEAASFRDLSLLLEKLEKTALKNRKEKSFKDEVSKIYQRKLNQNEKEVDRLQAFLKNPGATNPVAALWDTSEVQGLASVDMTPEEMVKPLMQGRGLQLDPTKFKKLLVLGGTMGNDGKAVEDPSLRFTEHEVTADGKLKEIRKSKKASAQVADIQHSFSDEDLKQAHPGVVAGFLIGAGRHALPAATNLVALAGPPGVAVAGFLQSGVNHMHDELFLSLSREQQAVVTAALKSSSGQTGGWVGLGASLASPFAVNSMRGSAPVSRRGNPLREKVEQSLKQSLISKRSVYHEVAGQAVVPEMTQQVSQVTPNYLGSPQANGSWGASPFSSPDPFGGLVSRQSELLRTIPTQTVSAKTPMQQTASKSTKSTTAPVSRRVATHKSQPNMPVMNAMAETVRLPFRLLGR